MDYPLPARKTSGDFVGVNSHDIRSSASCYFADSPARLQKLHELVAGDGGVEPPLPEPESGVLPLD